jgi:ketosteroid isomerase-like protein
MAETTASEREHVLQVLTSINEAGFGCDLDRLAELLDEAVVMVFPGFHGRTEGKQAMLSGFEDFCRNARLISKSESDHQVDIVGDVAVASFDFEVVYERDGKSYRSTGRDVWVLGKRDGEWRAVWRTMLDLSEEPEVTNDL